MRRRFLASLIVLAPVVAFAQSEHANYSGAKMPDTGGIDPRNDERVTRVTSTLSCNCGTCPHEPVSTCTCGTAARLRAEVAAFISKGKSSEEARVAMIDQYGYDIVPKPPFGGLNLIAWIGPFILIAIVGTMITMWLLGGSRRQQKAAAAAGAKAGSGPSPDAAADPYLARIEAELKAGES
jgi:cytochrome c-type biogenesis protein CcmH